MKNYKDITGQRYGKLVAEKYEGVKNKKTYWSCKCDCGNIISVTYSNLSTGNTTKCNNPIHRIQDLTGNKYGMLTVIKFAYTKNKKSYWLCKCDCGNEKVIRQDSFKNNREHKTLSCGCFNKKQKSEAKTHGMSNTKLYHVWAGMKDRCFNKNNSHFKDYGGRGIKVCDEWTQNFENFYNWSKDNGYEEGLSIDRIDNNKGYSPENCRWANQEVQCSNVRRNRRYTYNNKTLTITEWAKETGINRATLNARLNKGMSIEDAICTPIKK